MYVLRDLWNGRIIPTERFVRNNSNYQELLNRLSEEGILLRSNMSEDDKKRFDKYEDIQLGLIGISDEETFIEAFRLGARIMLDVVSDYRGTFYRACEAE